MMSRGFYGKGIPGVDPKELSGLLVVIEGADGSGRTTQSALVRDWLGRLGYPTTEVGLKRSTLVGPEIGEAMLGNTLGPRTMSLFYATDFADQLEHLIIPSLRAGFVVLADRYIFTLMARDQLRGAHPAWLRSVYGLALKPDMVLYLRTEPKLLAERSFRKHGVLDYWESGMDIERSGDMYQCFVRYQSKLQRELDRISKEYKFEEINGDRDPLSIHRDIQSCLSRVLTKRGVAKRAQEDDLEPSLISAAFSNGSNGFHREAEEISDLIEASERKSASSKGAKSAKTQRKKTKAPRTSSSRKVKKNLQRKQISRR